MLILLIEDNQDDARIVRDYLWLEPEAADYEIIHADSFTKALGYLEKTSFDLILLDLSLPDAEGVELVSRLREQTPESGIIVLTGLADRETALEALQMGAEEYLVKMDMTSSALLRTIRYAFERHNSRREVKQLRGRLLWAERGEAIANKAAEISAQMHSSLTAAAERAQELAARTEPGETRTLIDELQAALTQMQALSQELPEMTSQEEG